MVRWCRRGFGAGAEVKIITWSMPTAFPTRRWRGWRSIASPAKMCEPAPDERKGSNDMGNVAISCRHSSHVDSRYRRGRAYGSLRRAAATARRSLLRAAKAMYDCRRPDDPAQLCEGQGRTERCGQPDAKWRQMRFFTRPERVAQLLVRSICLKFGVAPANCLCYTGASYLYKIIPVNDQNHKQLTLLIAQRRKLNACNV